MQNIIYVHLTDPNPCTLKKTDPNPLYNVYSTLQYKDILVEIYINISLDPSLS
jgi:hypothetical protein